MIFEADLSKLDDVLMFVKESVNELVSEKEAVEMNSKIQFIVDELFANIALYSGMDGTVNVEINLLKNTEGKIVLEIADNGIAYNPLTAKTPDINLPLEEREVGGLGIYLVKNSVEKMEYKYEDGRNKLTIVI